MKLSRSAHTTKKTTDAAPQQHNQPTPKSVKQPGSFFPWFSIGAIIILILVLFFLHQQSHHQLPSETSRVHTNMENDTQNMTEQYPAKPENPIDPPTQTPLQSNKPAKTQTKASSNKPASPSKTQPQKNSVAPEQTKPKTTLATDAQAPKTNTPPKGVSLIAMSKENQEKIQKKHMPQLVASQPGPLSAFSNNVAAHTHSTERSVTQPANATARYNCLQSAYQHYFQQQILKLQWLRDALLSSNVPQANQAVDDYEMNIQQLDDEETLVTALFEIEPSRLRFDNNYTNWLPSINQQLRRELCRHSDFSCQAVIRHAVPTSSLQSAADSNISPYEAKRDQLMQSDIYLEFNAIPPANCPKG